LNAIQPWFGEVDLAILKEFVRSELDQQQWLQLPSGRSTHGCAMGQISQIAFELRKITKKQIDELDSDDDITLQQ